MDMQTFGEGLHKGIHVAAFLALFLITICAPLAIGILVYKFIGPWHLLWAVPVATMFYGLFAVTVLWMDQVMHRHL